MLFIGPIFNEKLPERNKTGFNQFILPNLHQQIYSPHHYKYLLVVDSSRDGASSSTGRLAKLLAHSGAVILLQASIFEYHFSAVLKPWVHYVPIAHNTADLTEKVEWLIEHDDLAQKLAKNAANFGKSYLRLEDYYCYMATALDLVGEALAGSDGLVPFNATAA